METRLCFYWKQSKVINPSIRCLRDGCIAATGFLINLALQMFCKGKRCPGLCKVVIGQRYWAGSPTAILWKAGVGNCQRPLLRRRAIRSKDGEHDMTEISILVVSSCTSCRNICIARLMNHTVHVHIVKVCRFLHRQLFMSRQSVSLLYNLWCYFLVEVALRY